jgi:iron(III) transport system permease protein
VGAHNLSLRNTLTYGVIAAVLSSVFALFAAFLVERGKWRGRRVLDFLLIMPAAVPGLFFGLGYVTAFNGTWLDDLDETGGVIITIALIFWNIPVGYQAAVAGLRQIDRTIDEAATSLGAGGLRMFRDVLMPMLGGSLRVGFTTTFVRAVTTLSLIIFLFTTQSVTATITIFQLVGDFNWGGAAAFTVADIGMAVIALLLIAIVSRGRISLGGARG